MKKNSKFFADIEMKKPQQKPRYVNMYKYKSTHTHTHTHTNNIPICIIIIFYFFIFCSYVY